MWKQLLAFARERTGLAAIEFAFVAPVMLLMFCGVFEVSQAIILYMKVIDAADTISDLVSQQKQVAPSDLSNYWIAGKMVMSPSPGSGLGVSIASVTFDSNDKPVVAWQVTRGSATDMTDLTSATVGLGAAGESVIVAQTDYTYTSLLQYVMKGRLTLSSRVFTRPRVAVSGIACPPPSIGGSCD
jgi:Flp pilus assembly protein TadG